MSVIVRKKGNSKSIRIFLLGVVTSLLSACLTSNKPLISEKNSITPFKAGYYCKQGEKKATFFGLDRSYKRYIYLGGMFRVYKTKLHIGGRSYWLGQFRQPASEIYAYFALARDGNRVSIISYAFERVEVPRKLLDQIGNREAASLEELIDKMTKLLNLQDLKTMTFTASDTKECS